MTDENIQAIGRVLDKRADRGASNQNLIDYLLLLKRTAWEKQPDIIDIINKYINWLK